MIQRLLSSIICLTAGIVLLALTGCGADETYSEYERTEAQFNAKLGGDISTLQWWKTAVELKVKVTTNTPVKLWVLSAEKGGTRIRRNRGKRATRFHRAANGKQHSVSCGQ